MKINVEDKCKTYRVKITNKPTKDYIQSMKFANDTEHQQIADVIIKETLTNIRSKKYKAYPEVEIGIKHTDRYHVTAVCRIKYTV